MNQTNRLLNEIYTTAAVGKDTLSAVINSAENPELIHELAMKRAEYRDIKKIAEKNLTRNGIYPKRRSAKNISAMAKASMKMHLMKRDDPSAIAKMVIQGNTMSMIGLLRDANKYDRADPDVINQAKNFAKSEQNFINKMKKYL